MPRSLREPPDPRLYEARSFICGTGGCTVTFDARPADRVASALLEDVGGWLRALRDLPDRSQIPAGVVAAVEAVHEAVANWSDLLAAGEASVRRKAPAVLAPLPPEGAS